MNIITLEGGSAEPPEPPSGYDPARAPFYAKKQKKKMLLVMCWACMQIQESMKGKGGGGIVHTYLRDLNQI